MAVQVWDVGKSKGLTVMVGIPVETLLDIKVCPRPIGLSL